METRAASSNGEWPGPVLHLIQIKMHTTRKESIFWHLPAAFSHFFLLCQTVIRDLPG